MKLRSWLLFTLVVFLWGSNWSMMKMGLRFASPVLFALHRFVVSVAVLLPFSLSLRGKMPKDRTTLSRLLLLGFVFVSIIIAQAFGLAQESSGIGAVLTYTQPLFVFCLAVPFLKENVTAAKLAGVGVGFMGVFLLFLEKASSFLVGSDLVMLLSALLWAVAAVYYKRFLSHVNPLVAHFMQLSVGTIPLAVLAFAIGGYMFPTDALYVWIVLSSSVGALALGNVVWFYLLRKEEATTLAGSSLVIPAVALLFGWQLLGESLSLSSIVGSILSLAGVCIINIRRG